MTRAPAVLALTLAAVSALAPADAAAFYGNGAAIMSASDARQEQGDASSTYAVVSSDAAYVAFETRASNFFADDDPDPPGQIRTGGIFRRSVRTGVLELVADGDFRDEEDPDTIYVQGAHNPSISADGRFVAFSTAQQLVPADANDAVDVYLRDMNVPVRSPGAFTLVSAKDGGDQPATYDSPLFPRPGRNPGTDVWPGAAISADGNRVAFVSQEVADDLPDASSPVTAPYQVFVRDIAARTTRLVTHESSDPALPAGGAAGPAAISGDGSTVAWTGSNAPAQTRFLPGENDSTSTNYYLWQRIADGAGAPTRRITGAADPDDPSCPPGGHADPVATATGPCYGPLTGPEGSLSSVITAAPALSADGRRVAFLVSTGPRPNDQTANGLDLWVTDMRPGVTRKAGSRELTREGTGDLRSSPAISGVALSADGRHVAISTSRASFVLPGLKTVGTFRSAPTQRDVAVIDLTKNTIERATRAADGGDTDGSASQVVSISGDGLCVAFADSAPNLFYGDANESADAFLVTRVPDPKPRHRPPPDDGPPVVIVHGRHLKLTAKRAGVATVRVRAKVPRAGKVTAVARGRLPGRHWKHARTLGKATAHARAAGFVRLTLRLRPAYRLGGDVKARVKATFTPSGAGHPLSGSVKVTFHLDTGDKR